MKAVMKSLNERMDYTDFSLVIFSNIQVVK